MNHFETTISHLRKKKAAPDAQAPLIRHFCAATVKKRPASKPQRSLIEEFSDASTLCEDPEADRTRVQGLGSHQVEVSTLYELIKQRQ
mmetsp:Transcript_33468/g.51395  ORF Transcript_33468/g.51395 Transcript_33468/m.51395 type:complete len:88 (+) Transcript_33468:2-265(+)